MFHDTIRANLAYARPSATEEELIGACRAAQIWGLIESLPDGLDTVVGDRGYRLSTIREADQILVIDGGHIRERGQHEELLAAGGLYAELYHTQFADQEPSAAAEEAATRRAGPPSAESADQEPSAAAEQEPLAPARRPAVPQEPATAQLP